MVSNFNNYSIFKHITLFSGLSDEQLSKIISISSKRLYEKEDVIFWEGDRYAGFYILVEGLVKVYNISEQGMETIVHLIKPNNAFAELPLFEGEKYPVSAQCLEKSELLFFPKDEFLSFLKENPEIMLKMLAGFAHRLRVLVNKVNDLTSKDVVSRVAKYLLNELLNNGTLCTEKPELILTTPKSTLASFLGTVPETLSRTFKKLQTEDIIEIKERKITVKDLKKLKIFAYKHPKR